MKYRATIAAWFSSFFENALVSLMKRRIDIRIVRKMVKARNLRREQMIGDALQLTLDLDHWNSINPAEEPITADLDLTDEVEWRKNAPDERKDKKAG